jgi:hypothetical protein
MGGKVHNVQDITAAGTDNCRNIRNYTATVGATLNVAGVTTLTF